MEGRVGRIKEKLLNKFYHMNDTWLNDCLEYYLSENLNATDDETLNFVTAQWQLSDLREISSERGCLPRNLGQQKSTTLPGKYILQVEKGYDISTSKYKQLEGIRKVSTENIRATDVEEDKPWEIKSKRMMQLFLTDGIQDISAIEYRPIRFLKDVILPGFKIMIKGPVPCRRGVILLQEDNLLDIGGEVEHLLISNAPENVFARALNMPENADPYNDTNQQNADAALLDDDLDVDFDELTELELSKARRSCSTGSMRPKDHQKPVDLPVCFEAEVESTDLPDDDDLLFDLVNEEELNLEPGRSRETASELRSSSFPDDDDLALISEPKATSSTNPNFGKDATTKIKEAEQLGDLGDLDNVDWEEFEMETAVMAGQGPVESNVCRERSLKQEKVRNSPVSSFFSPTSDNARTKKIAPPEIAKPSTVKSVQASTSRGSSPMGMKCDSEALNLPTGSRLILSRNSKNTGNSGNSGHTKGILDYFKKTDRPEPPKLCDFICEFKNLAVQGKRKIWARTKCLGKLGKGKDGWMLEGTISDDTENLDVEFASEILEKELGYTVAEFAVQKKQRKNNPELEQKLRQTFRRADEKLRGLDGLVELELSGKKPKVLSIRDLTESERRDITARRKRLGF